MKLIAVSRDDLALYESMFCDEAHMADLGGVQPREKIPGILDRQVACMESGRGWVYKVVPELEDLPAGTTLTEADISSGVGTVGIWGGEWKDQPVTEMCWGVAPKFQGNKFGKKSVGKCLELAVRDGRWGTIHVFTSTSNAPSNALCLSCGFKFQGEESVEYDGRQLHTNHYTYDTSTK